AQLRKIGAKFYDVESGLAYNPAASIYGSKDYTLTSANGVSYTIDSVRGTVAIRSALGNLVVGDSGVIGPGGNALLFVRNSLGKVERVTGPGGVSVVYEYDQKGNLTAVRDLAEARSVRYGYEGERLV